MQKTIDKSIFLEGKCNFMENKPKIPYIYAIIIFSSALLLILITSTSRNYINEEENKLTKQMGMFEGIQATLHDLKEENNRLKEKLNFQQEKQKEMQESINELKDEKLLIMQNADDLLLAKDFYYIRDYINCAEYLYKVNTELLGEKARKEYNLIAGEVFEKASRTLYMKGYRDFKNKMYSEAIKNFETSLKYKNDMYYSDDAMYYLALSYKNINETDKSKQIFDEFIKTYPDSLYVKWIK